ncbi:hypothetical protein Y032_0501g2601 [Ancylostoma ceylanicum]|uniref:Uncharacterized protein n=1 Tax=Ancylostoma ceylanicum TaxID=53326 RepID=A0A016WVY5_9BILA|nr:hypothetical protein Y032_0501g2601 [Ancylostoma ceylanicum]
MQLNIIPNAIKKEIKGRIDYSYFPGNKTKARTCITLSQVAELICLTTRKCVNVTGYTPSHDLKVKKGYNHECKRKL